MKPISVLLPIALLLSFGHVAAAQPPQTVTELWADFDPRKAPLDVEIVREWQMPAGKHQRRHGFVCPHAGVRELRAAHSLPDAASQRDQ